MITLKKCLINFSLIVITLAIKANETDKLNVYAKRHPSLVQTFIDHTNEKEAAIEVTSFLLTKFNMLYSNYFKNNLRICDIGCGEGNFTSLFLKMISTFLPHGITDISYTGIEQQLKLINDCKENIKKIGLDHYDFYQNRFENLDFAFGNFLSNCILTSHSCYSMNDCTLYINKLKNISQANTLAIFIHGIDSPMNKLQERIGHILLRAKHHANVVEKIARGLDHENITYITVYFNSSISFPKLAEEEWNFFYEKIDQDKYDKDYTSFGINFMIAKNLIDFSIAEPLEGFDINERKIILDEFRKLINHENKIVYTNALQIALIKPDNNNIRNAFEALR